MPTNFLEAAGTNGFIASPFTLMSTELNSLANGNSAESSVGGTSGLFTSANYAQAIWCMIYLTLGGSLAPNQNDSLSGWFLFSPDGGTTLEAPTSNADMARAADFIIPFAVLSYTTGNLVRAGGLVMVPWWANKVLVVSHVTAASLPSSGNLIKAAPVAIQY